MEQTLAQKLSTWAEEELRIKAAQEANNTIKKEIEEAVQKSGEEIRLANGPKCIFVASGGYEWEKIARVYYPTLELIQKYSSVSWNKVAEEAYTIALEDSKQNLFTEPLETLDSVKKKYHYDNGNSVQCRVK